jgi:putative oligomerization/nucleic acid binding protein
VARPNPNCIGALVVAAGLYGCAPSSQSSYSWSNVAYAPGSPVRVGECPYTVVFPGSVQSTTDVPKGANVDRALSLANWDASSVVISVCGCSNTLDLGEIPEAVAVQGLEWQLKSTGGRVSDVKFTDEGVNGKALSATLETEGDQGHLQLLARANYFGKCSFLVAGGGRIGEFDHQRVARFMETAKRIGAQSTAPTSSGTVRRLEELKDLRDRNLITPQEYETRRKAILDAL